MQPQNAETRSVPSHVDKVHEQLERENLDENTTSGIEVKKSKIRKSKSKIKIPEISEPKIAYFDENNDPKYSFPQDSEDNNLVYLTENGIVDKNKKYWTWEIFNIERIYNYPNGEIRVDFTLNTENYHKKLISDLVNIAYERACISKKNYFSILLHKFLKDRSLNVPIILVVATCGFRKNGWQLPPDFDFESKSAIKQQSIRCIQRAMQQKVNRKSARKYARELYNAISVKYKGILLAYSMIGPFFDALMDYTDLRPYLILIGDNSTGKTQIAKVLTVKIWGNFEDVIAPNNIENSPSRMDDYQSTSTFGIVYDDVGSLHPSVLAKWKSNATSRNRNQKKNIDHELVLDDEMVAWIILTGNEIPQTLNDAHFLSRGLAVPINTQPTEEQKKQFKSVYNKIPNGYLGKFIVEMTKDWTVDNVLAIYDKQKPKNGYRIRQNTIYRLILTGAEIFEHVFGFPLQIDLEELNSLLQSTLTIDDDDVISTVRIQIRGSIEYNHEKIVNHTLRNGTKGVVYLSPATHDLKKEMGKKYSLVELRKILRRNWSKVPKTEGFTIGRHTSKGIFIPEEYYKESE